MGKVLILDDTVSDLNRKTRLQDRAKDVVGPGVVFVTDDGKIRTRSGELYPLDGYGMLWLHDGNVPATDVQAMSEEALQRGPVVVRFSNGGGQVKHGEESALVFCHTDYLLAHGGIFVQDWLSTGIPDFDILAGGALGSMLSTLSQLQLRYWRHEAGTPADAADEPDEVAAAWSRVERLVVGRLGSSADDVDAWRCAKAAYRNLRELGQKAHLDDLGKLRTLLLDKLEPQLRVQA